MVYNTLSIHEWQNFVCSDCGVEFCNPVGILMMRKQDSKLFIIPDFEQMDGFEEYNYEEDTGNRYCAPHEWYENGILVIEGAMLKKLHEVLAGFSMELIKEFTKEELDLVMDWEEAVRTKPVGFMDMDRNIKIEKSNKMNKEHKIAHEVVKQYAKGLRTLDLDIIVPILHPEFKFVYRLSEQDNVKIIAHPSRVDEARLRNPGTGHGIRTDVRYIGHLYKTFLAMKKEDHTIKTNFFYPPMEGTYMIGIKLLPPHYRGIIFPMDYQVKEELRSALPAGEVFLLPRVKHGLICKVECYTSMDSFNFHVAGTFYRGVDK